MSVKIKTFQLPVNLIEKAKNALSLNDNFKAIRECIDFIYLNQLHQLSTESLDIYHLINVEERKDKKPYSVLVGIDILDTICIQSGKSGSEAVVDAIVRTLSYKQTSSEKNASQKNLLTFSVLSGIIECNRQSNT